MVWNKNPAEELLAKINWLQFGSVGIKNIEPNVNEVVSHNDYLLTAEDVGAYL